MRRIRENLPEWVDKLPELPGLLLALSRGNPRLDGITAALEAARREHRQEVLKRQRQTRLTGIAALAMAGASLIPPVAGVLTGAPLLTLFLGLTGAFLLLRSQ